MLAVATVSSAAARPIGRRPPVSHRPLPTSRDITGAGNNRAHPTWGATGANYVRVAPANYADGRGAVAAGPNARFVSNRIFNDTSQNLFSENNISQWGWAWGQFIDHDMGLRDETPAEDASIPFDASDRLESFSNETGSIAFDRTPAAPGTGSTSPREQVNSLTSYLDASNVYGVTTARMNWLRNPDGTLMLPAGYLPKVTSRGSSATAPAMDLMGRLAGDPNDAVVAGDVRANENIGLTSIQTLFAREHNRIVGTLPRRLSGGQKYQIARAVVGAEIQYITYNEFLPALGVQLPRYRGYRPNVNAGISNEFATVGFRAHSMVHGDFDVDFDSGEYSASQLAAFTAQGISVTNDSSEHSLVVPLGLAFGNPDLLPQVGLGSLLASLAGEHQYKNDEQIDNELRSVLFEIPQPGATGVFSCQDPNVNADCFSDIADLGADDVMRGRDHGMPTYNEMRKAYGLPPVTSFTQITGESTEALPAGLSINDPRILQFVELRDLQGNAVDPSGPDAQQVAVSGVRRSTLAARLAATYGTVDKVDAFVGMVSEQHVAKAELGPLQMAMWKDQFTRLRDGDRFFYQVNPMLAMARRLGVTYAHPLSDIIRANTGAVTARDVFHAPLTLVRRCHIGRVAGVDPLGSGS